jgi:hypothetical protein
MSMERKRSRYKIKYENQIQAFSADANFSGPSYAKVPPGMSWNLFSTIGASTMIHDTSATTPGGYIKSIGKGSNRFRGGHFLFGFVACASQSEGIGVPVLC